MSRLRPECPDSDPPNRLLAADVFLRQEPDDEDEEEEEEEEEEDEDEDVGNGKEDDGDDDKDDDGYSEGAPRSNGNGCRRRDVWRLAPLRCPLLALSVHQTPTYSGRWRHKAKVRDQLIWRAGHAIRWLNTRREVFEGWDAHPLSPKRSFLQVTSHCALPLLNGKLRLLRPGYGSQFRALGSPCIPSCPRRRTWRGRNRSAPSRASGEAADADCR